MAESLRRYTSALAFLDMLQNHRLTLLSPARWFDQNDALGLEAYSKLRGDGSVYAMCLAIGVEQAHHWQLFAGSDHGVRVRFDRNEFADHLDQYAPAVRHGPVIYQNLTQIRDRSPISEEDLPFLKRNTFEAEREYRIVAWEEKFFADNTFTVPLPISLIKQIVFGPAMPDSFVETMLDVVRTRKNFFDLDVSRSRLVNNKSWQNVIAEGLNDRVS